MKARGTHSERRAVKMKRRRKKKWMMRCLNAYICQKFFFLHLFVVRHVFFFLTLTGNREEASNDASASLGKKE